MNLELLSAITLLFLVVDPFGNIPIVLSALGAVPEARRRRVILREAAIATVTLLVFLAFGEKILAFLNLSQVSVRLAGGVVLFLIALRMIFPSGQGVFGDSAQEPLIVPIAIPSLAGPSSLATVILIDAQAPHNFAINAFAVLLVMLACTAVLLLADPIRRRVGARGIEAIERLTGLLLAAISVQMMLDGIATFLASLH